MPRRRVVFVAAAVLLLPGCGSCGDRADDVTGDDAAVCSFSICDRECRERGLCYGSCAAGTCNCTAVCGGDADADARDDAGVRDDARGGEADDAGAPECWLRSTGETRPGASPGVTCRRISVPEVEYALLQFSGDGDRVVSVGDTAGAPGFPVWIFDRRTRCLNILDDGADTPGFTLYGGDPSVDGHRVAYRMTWFTDAPTGSVQHCQLRLLDLATGEKRVLDESVSAIVDSPSGRSGCNMDYIVLDYPWVVWRDVREHDGHPGIGWNWYAMAINAETGEKMNISRDPEDLYVNWWAIRVDLLGAVATWSTGNEAGTVAIVDLASRERRIISPERGLPGFATITPEWIAWVSQRARYPPRPEEWRDLCNASDMFCMTDIYGYNRLTGEERALVVAGNTMQGDEVDGEGPWLVYEDQRDGGDGDPRFDRDREEDIFALHLPTMTEIKLTDWAGYELIPRAYDRGDGTYGALLVWEISYYGANYILWDCDLPAP